jgi:hypothetical protein
MKKFMFSLVLFGAFFSHLIGCGGSTETKIIEPSSTTMTAENQSAYEAQMKKGGSGAFAPGN